MGKKLTALLMSLIVVLPLATQAWAAPQIAQAATDMTGTVSKQSTPATAETPATDTSKTNIDSASSSSSSSATTNSLPTPAADTQKSDIAPVNADTSTGLTSQLIFTDGSIDSETTFEAHRTVQLKLLISNSGQAQPFTGGEVVIKLPKKQFMPPAITDFTAGQDYMTNKVVDIDADSDPDNYLIKYQLKTVGAGSKAELPFYVALAGSQDVGTKATITQTIYKSAGSTEVVSQNQVFLPYTVEILTGFTDGGVTLKKENWNGMTLDKSQDMDISRMLRFSYMYGSYEDPGSTNSPFFINVTLPKDKVTFDAAQSPDWTYNATTGIATYHTNHKLSNTYPSKLIVHPILSSHIQAEEKIPFHFQTGFVNDNPKNYLAEDHVYIFKQRKTSYISDVNAVYSKYKNSDPRFTEVNSLDVIQDQVSDATTYNFKITPIQISDFEEGDVATIQKFTVKPNLDDGSLHLTKLRFYHLYNNMSALVQQELQNNTVTLTDQNGNQTIKHNLALGESIDLGGKVYKSIEIKFARPITLDNTWDTMFYLDIGGHLDQKDVDDFKASSEIRKTFTVNEETQISEQEELVKSADLLELKKSSVESVQPKITRGGGIGNGVQVRPYNLLFGPTALVDFGITITNPNQLAMKNPRVYFLLPQGLVYEEGQSAQVKNLHDVQVTPNYVDGQTLVTGIPNVDNKTTGNVIFTIPTTATKTLVNTLNNIHAYFAVDNNYFTKDVNDPRINENFEMDDVSSRYYNNYTFFDTAQDPKRGVNTEGSFNYTPPASLSITSTSSLTLTNFVEDLGNILQPDEKFNYQLKILNSNASAISKFRAIDVLPFVDGANATMFSLADTTEPEKSEFAVQLTGPVKVVDDYDDYFYGHKDLTDQYDIYYSTEAPDATPEVNDTKDGWTLTPADYSQVRMIKIVLKDGQTIGARKGIDIQMPVIAPKSNLTLPGKQAFNSFALSTDDGKNYLDSNNSRVSIHQEQGNLNITKLDNQDKQRPLAGAKFKIYDATTKQEVDETAATSASGTVTSYNLPVGTYYAVESVAPNGYTLDTTPTANFEITDGKDTPLTIYNERNTEDFGTVTLNYVDAETKEKIPGYDSQVLSDVIGTEYNVGLTKYFMTIPGYKADSYLTTGLTDESYIGKFTKEPQDITFYYHKYAKVTIESLDHQNNKLFADQTISDIPGKSYDTSENVVQIEGYQLDNQALPDNASGKYTTADQVVKYYYNKLAAPITINYIDELTKDILTSARLSGLAGEKYDASQAEYQLTIPGYELDSRKLPTNTKGVFSDASDTIEYFYRKFSSPVTVQYVDEAGKEIANVESQKLSGFVGDDYDTNNSKYQLAIPGYDLDQAKIPTNAAGKYSNDPITVTYVYKQVAKPVTVQYLDQNDHEFAPSKQLPLADLGTKYDATTIDYRQEFAGYELDQTKLPTNATGEFGTEPIIVTYHYNQIAKPVNVKYVDQNGKTIKTVKPITGNVGDEYKTEQAEISGYKFDRMKDDTPTKGVLGTTELTVTYIYNEIAKPVTVKYVDQTGKPILDSKEINGNVGDKYDAGTADYKLSKAGYDLDESKLPKNVTGQLTNAAQTVTYVYSQIAKPVNIKYVDQTGKEIKKVAPITGHIGDSYQTKQAEIAGYEFDRMKDDTPTEGVLGTTELTVTYIYNEIAKPVTVKYVDQSGKEILSSKVINGHVGDKYDAGTAEYKLSKVGYELDESKLPKNVTGQLTNAAQTVTYIYTQNSQPVTVKYVDQAGKTIHADQTIEGEFGKAYDATTSQYQLAISGYELVKAQLPKNAQGQFGANAITVTYVYRVVTSPEKPTKPTEPSKPEPGQKPSTDQNGSSSNKTNAANQNKTSESAATKQKKLPQASEATNDSLIKFVVGMFLMFGLLIYTTVDFRKSYRD
ncbi:MucBP domain-containing protein [Lapidilactobacillus wuchangensis]|uniref:MucBP domain-containing protein n=1 Tax=Lapidilactobacillus wuchangensis TaxID=2486001 RepID=UPI0013DE3E2A|nr:MucBP domain-containing protein [Lapidilactobacillus wuchangensis]